MLSSSELSQLPPSYFGDAMEAALQETLEFLQSKHPGEPMSAHYKSVMEYGFRWGWIHSVDHVAAGARHAVAEEREACAKLVEGSEQYDSSDCAAQLAVRVGATKALATAIRARRSKDALPRPLAP